MEFRQFQYAFRVAETKHFGKAAELEHIAPSVLSVQIRRLEEALGLEVFHRTARGVELTEAGEHFIRETQVLFASLEDIKKQSLAIARVENTHLSVGLFGEVAGELTHLIFSAFTTTYPEVALQFVELTMSTQFEALANGEVDVALIRLPIDDRNYRITHLFEEPRSAAVPTHSILSGASELSISDLIDEGFAIAGAGTPSAWSSYWSLDDQRGGRSPVAATVNTLPESLSAVAYGNAVDTYPVSATRSFAHPGVTFVPLRDAAPSVLCLASKRDNPNRIIQEFEVITKLVVQQHIHILPGALSLIE